MSTQMTTQTALSDLAKSIERAAHLLPAQGPITVFVHHNTLHAFEEMNFYQAVLQGANTFGCHPYLSEIEYRGEMDSGAISQQDLKAALMEDLADRDDELIGVLGTRYELRLSMLSHPMHVAPASELRWLVSETDALRKLRREVDPETGQRMIATTRRWILQDVSNQLGTRQEAAHVPKAIAELLEKFSRRDPADWSLATWESFTLHLLWRACRQGVHHIAQHAHHGQQAQHLVSGQRHRDLLYAATGQDCDLAVHELLIRFCAAFLDQGLSQWSLPDREKGFFQSFLSLYKNSSLTSHFPLSGLSKELQRISQIDLQPAQSIAESLHLMGITESETDEFIAKTLLALRGWAGMIHQMEIRGDRVARAAPPGTLLEFLAVRLILDRLVVQQMAEKHIGSSIHLSSLRAELKKRSTGIEASHIESRAFTVFQLAQIRGWTPQSLFSLPKSNWQQLIHEVEAFSSTERRKVFQLALERTYRQQVLSAYAQHTRRYWLPKFGEQNTNASLQPTRPNFQIICCIDDREESFRRHLEEIDPHCETFGAAGFFSAAMYYRGAHDAHFVPLCPIIMKPQHYVIEQVDSQQQDQYGRMMRVRRSLGKQAHEFHTSSRTFLGGLGTALVGPLATIPLVARVLFPRSTAQFRRLVGNVVQPRLPTRLTLERQTTTPSQDPEGLGFTLSEMVGVVERLLQDTGLTTNFSQWVIVCGHGSASLNNPHESAYNCGACGGGRGGPNARAIADMANRTQVRTELAARGLTIPEDTIFMGAYHNTCTDQLEFFETSRVPLDRRGDWQRLVDTFYLARQRNAHERCRRFESAPLSINVAAALRHVEARAEDLSQTRPEYNHATNAICTVGRRSRTRGLFLDRRSFLVSYDPRQDDAEHSILTRILQAVVPVCSGINLEYYFSRVDVPGYGCGTKLPHNVTSLIGVMDGAASDLRTGLSAQMTEIHDPVRLLFIIETTPAAFLQIMQRNPVIQRICGNGWVQVATLDPHSDTIDLLQGDSFSRFQGDKQALAQVSSSMDWYRGWRGNLGLAHVLGGLSPTRTTR